MPDAPTLVHGTVVAVGDAGVLLRGAPGSGKSDLALRCISRAPGPLFDKPVALVADDYAELEVQDGSVIASAPSRLFGKMEVRGIGLVDVSARRSVPLAMLIDLVSDRSLVERLPDKVARETILGVSLPVLHLFAFEPSAPEKVVLAATCGPSIQI